MRCAAAGSAAALSMRCLVVLIDGSPILLRGEIQSLAGKTVITVEGRPRTAAPAAAGIPRRQAGQCGYCLRHLDHNGALLARNLRPSRGDCCSARSPFPLRDA
jgi:aerobic-type carbon monoxide dehydrogenase small subunit (CoxS/CutS family)